MSAVCLLLLLLDTTVDLLPDYGVCFAAIILVGMFPVRTGLGYTRPGAGLI